MNEQQEADVTLQCTTKTMLIVKRHPHQSNVDSEEAPHNTRWDDSTVRLSKLIRLVCYYWIFTIFVTIKHMKLLCCNRFRRGVSNTSRLHVTRSLRRLWSTLLVSNGNLSIRLPAFTDIHTHSSERADEEETTETKLRVVSLLLLVYSLHISLDGLSPIVFFLIDRLSLQVPSSFC